MPTKANSAAAGEAAAASAATAAGSKRGPPPPAAGGDDAAAVAAAAGDDELQLDLQQQRQQRPAKAPRLGDDRVAAMPAGCNLIEADGKQCTHEVLWPPGAAAAAQGSTAPPPQHAGPPARTYKFALDPFQRTAINALEAGHNVLVAAHTSAGKTVVAEYAFAMGLRDKMRVVYTSPLKALSNQKFKELREEFVDVGLMTGDVTINPEATCLVMTTEILRSMLYHGSEVVREVGLFVHDEVHYLRDVERGVVWEESIVLAPKGARMAFLSATIPNSSEFAGWVAATHGSPVHVVYTDFRPTPLQHYLFPAGAEGLFMVVDERGVFRDDAFQQAVAALADAEAAAAAGGKGGGGGKGGAAAAAANGGPPRDGPGSDIYKLVVMAMARGLDPLIVFSLSKTECERLAKSIAGLELNTKEEAAIVEGVFRAATETLSDEDRKLVHVQRLLPMLKRGVGVHHSGLLPVCKEVTEILFGEGLLKVLFATETFSTGLNMPAKTVAFTRARKWDGSGFRWLRSGEYIQMSGRAGRRGLDDRGVVILMFDTKMEPAIAREMIKGAPDPLLSAFRLRSSQLLALSRQEDASPELLLRASFRQWQARCDLPRLEARAAELAAARGAVVIEGERDVEGFAELLRTRLRLQEAVRAAVADPAAALRFLQPGRLVKVDALPPDLDRPLPPLGPYTPPPPAAAAAAAAGDAAAAGAAGAGAGAGAAADEGGEGGEGDDGAGAAGGDGAEVVRRTDTGVWGVLVNFEKASKRQAGHLAQGAASALGDAEGGSDDDGGGGGGSSRPSTSGRSSTTGPRYVIDVLLNVSPDALPRRGAGLDRFAWLDEGGPRPVGAVLSGALLPPGAPGGVPIVLTLPLEHLAAISSVRLRALKDLRSVGARAAGLDMAAEAISRLAARAAQQQQHDGGSGKGSSKGGGGVIVGAPGPPLLDPESDLQLRDHDAARAASRLEAVEQRLATHPLWRSRALLPRLAALQHREALAQELRAVRREIKGANGLVLADELKARTRVLRRLGYLDEGGLVTVKGRVAADLSSGHDELVLSELLLGGAFADLDPDQVVALCSCFVWGERALAPPRLPERMQGPFAALRKAARLVGGAAADAKLDADVDAFVERFRPEAMEAAAAWTQGRRFAEVVQIMPKGTYEGSIVRAVRRLDELMRQVVVALTGVGDLELAARFKDASQRVRRDIIFAPSLYL